MGLCVWEPRVHNVITDWIYSLTKAGPGDCMHCRDVKWESLFAIKPKYAAQHCDACGGVVDSTGCILSPVTAVEDRCGNHTTPDECATSSLYCDWIAQDNFSAACSPKSAVHLTATRIPLEAKSVLETALENLTEVTLTRNPNPNPNPKPDPCPNTNANTNIHPYCR